MIPTGAILLEEQNRLASGADAGRRARRLNLHQGDEPMHFGLIGRQLCHDTSEAERISIMNRMAFSSDQAQPLPSRKACSCSCQPPCLSFGLAGKSESS